MSIHVVTHAANWAARFRDDQSAQGSFAWQVGALAQYQDPSKADKMTKIQQQLDETTAVMVP